MSLYKPIKGHRLVSTTALLCLQPLKKTTQKHSQSAFLNCKRSLEIMSGKGFLLMVLLLGALYLETNAASEDNDINGCSVRLPSVNM